MHKYSAYWLMGLKQCTSIAHTGSWDSSNALVSRLLARETQANARLPAHIIIIIIRKGRQCKAGRERLTPYQSEDPNPTAPTHRIKEEKGKTVGDKK